MSGENKPRAHRRWPWIVAIVAVAAIAVRVSVGRRDQDGASARLAAAVAGQETIIVSTGDVHELVSATGHLVPVAARTLSFDMSGRITKLRVEEGSRVTEGSTICELEAGGADLARSVLSGGYLGSLEQLPSSVAPGVTEQQHGLIKAPFDGVIASVNAGIGSYVSAGQPVATVIDTSSHIAEIEIDEIDLARVKPGMEATISFDAIPGVKLPGKVDYIAAMAVPRGGMVTIPVKVAIEGSHELLKPGLTASVKILSHTLTNVVNIPIRAWIDHEGEPSVVRIEDDIPEFVPLELGLSDGERTHVLSGLEPGDVIVADAVAVQERLRRASAKDRFITFDVQHIEE
ncbi:MAG: efflux RND transporter periplasmic adaptor subunit [Firmicutes bacterium]|jgi:macrolide-specific efflux system membrane fusion protein|nr:efflux RND transporter periplasmic adaptor subunit [Bacillota bacterium]MDD4337611.1 efflux RND transporter periplasmic adaptor subunit [Bacillota bacterium]